MTPFLEEFMKNKSDTLQMSKTFCKSSGHDLKNRNKNCTFLNDVHEPKPSSDVTLNASQASVEV